jgi:CHAT domain-containing protein/tetratricopeptide (TPR) repeat protein
MNSPQRIPGEKIEELLDRLLDRGNSVADAPLYPSVPSLGRGADCPEDAVWQRIALRPTRDEDSRDLIDHAAGCQRCGTILNFWASVLCEEETPEESSALARLSTQSLGWQERMTKTLAGAKQPAKAGRKRGRAVWPMVLGIAGTIAATGLVFLFVGNSRSQSSPERLLAEAYSGHRIMEPRIPLAGYAAVDAAHHSRAAGANAMSDSVPLLEARAAITQALMKTPEDPHWLMLQARSDLLNENYDTAIDTLKRLHAGDPANVAVLTDLASAYNMRSKATDAAADEATALDYLEQAARLEPKNPVVLYNEAVVLQDLFQYANAVDVWKRFLAVEHDPAWVSDGKRRLAEIEAREAKVKAQQSRLDPFLGSPEGMLHLARSPAVVADYDEELSTIDLPQLLKTAFPIHPSGNSPSSDLTPHPAECTESCSAARALLQAIAVSLQEHHHDRWLIDLLASSDRQGFAEAANLLASAIDQGQHSDFPDGLRDARLAQGGFERLGDLSGVTRARIEEVFNLEHVPDDRKCLAAAEGLAAVFAENTYPWMAAQFWADESACHIQQDDFAAARASLDRSMQISSASDLRIVHLRAFGFIASNEESIGNRDLVWKMDMQGLRSYWNGNYPAVRKLQFYGNLSYAEDSSSRVFCSVLLHREGLSEVAPLGYARSFNSVSFLLVKAEIRAGEVKEAAEDLERAQAGRSALPNDAVLRESITNMGTYLAEAYLSRENLSAASAVLQTVSDNMAGTGNRDMELRFSSAAGHLALLENQPAKAEDELSRSVSIAELGYRETPGMQDRMDWIERERPTYAALALLRLREGKSPLEALAIWERYRVLSSGVSLDAWCHNSDLTCLAEPLDAMRKTLKQETILGTIRLDRSLLVWTMDDRGIRFHEVGIDPDRFDLLCRTFEETLATPASSEASIRFYGKRLAISLLAPAATTLDAQRTMVFDLDDSMEFLPVAAMPWNSGYLGQQIATGTVHSVLLADRRPSSANSSLVSVVVGASNPGDAEVSRLPEARAEAMAVAGFLARPKVLVGGDALASSIEAAAPHAALFHFAGHTRLVDGGTRLLLAQPAKSGPDWLDARAFRSRAFANCRLVVLSACSTGKREERDSDDIQDIVQTLAAEGTQQIVATHWDVDSAASVSLMKEFYSGLARGLTVPQAMLQAEQAVSSIAEYRHPYFWAPYYVIGLRTTNLKELFHDD